MKRIIYISNYMSHDLVEKRNNINVFSQAGNNKTMGIYNALSSAGCKVEMLSTGLVSGRSGKIYSKEEERYNDGTIFYATGFAAPFFNTIVSGISLWRKIKQECAVKIPDYILFYNFKLETALPAYLAKKRYGVPIAVEYEDGYDAVNEVAGIKRKILIAIESFMLNKIDSAIIVTSKVAEKFRVPTTVVRGIINTQYYEYCKTHVKKEHDKLMILYTGGLDKARGIDVLLKAIQYCDFDFRLVITGKGKMEFQDDRVEFLGFVPFECVQELTAEADVLVQCQLAGNDFGNVSFPSKMYEYIASGNYIVSSTVSDIKEFAGDNIALYDNDSPEELANLLRQCNDLWKSGKLKNNGVESLRERNMPETIGQQICSMLFRRD